MVKEKFYEIRELSDEINHDYLTCYFKHDAAKKKELVISIMVLGFLKKYNLVNTF